MTANCPPHGRVNPSQRAPQNAPSRATLFAGQYPSLHGVTSTDGVAKQNTDPRDAVARPQYGSHLGAWFGAGAYRTHFRGKWHVSFADLTGPLAFHDLGALKGLLAGAI